MPDKKLTDNLSNNSPNLSNSLSDNEIKKALEYCSKQGITSECEKCKMPKNTCRTELIGYAFDLINRKDEEINRLQAENKRLSTLTELGNTRANDYRVMRDRALKAEAEVERLEKEVEIKKQKRANMFEIASAFERGKTEAYKECIEKVKEQSNKMELVCSGVLVRTDYTITEERLDNLLKELTEKSN